MKLSVQDRILLLEKLPREGTYLTMKVLIELKLSLSFSEAEIKDFGITEKEKGISWKKSDDKDVDIGEKATEIISDVLRKLDKDGKLKEKDIPLFEKFIKS